ncbi:MAG: rhodanese-like domain-containing protein [Pseudomonadota bacterium]
MKHSPRFLSIVNRVKQHIKETDVATVKKMLDAKENFHLIDVREQSELDKGHLPNAIHLSKGLIECNIEKTLTDTSEKMVLYCGGGFRSALAAYNLQLMGYENVISMDGGFRGWHEAGYEITSKDKED